jgi:hypothetical protein
MTGAGWSTAEARPCCAPARETCGDIVQLQAINSAGGRLRNKLLQRAQGQDGRTGTSAPEDSGSWLLERAGTPGSCLRRSSLTNAHRTTRLESRSAALGSSEWCGRVGPLYEWSRSGLNQKEKGLRSAVRKSIADRPGSKLNAKCETVQPSGWHTPSLIGPARVTYRPRYLLSAQQSVLRVRTVGGAGYHGVNVPTV